MKALLSIFTLILTLTCQPIFAHRVHAHGPININQAKSLAVRVSSESSTRDVGLEIGQLEKSWASLGVDNASMHKTGNGYYIVAVTNTKENKTLYVLMSNSGKIYDANFTGTFANIK